MLHYLLRTCMPIHHWQPHAGIIQSDTSICFKRTKRTSGVKVTASQDGFTSLQSKTFGHKCISDRKHALQEWFNINIYMHNTVCLVLKSLKLSLHRRDAYSLNIFIPLVIMWLTLLILKLFLCSVMMSLYPLSLLLLLHTVSINGNKWVLVGMRVPYITAR